MRLHELYGIKKAVGLYKNYSTRLDFQNYMEELGFRFIASGSYGWVYSNPNLDYVVKIIRNDQCYFKFVKYVLDNQNNSHLPKMFGKYIKIGNSPEFLVRIEKLNPLDADEYYDSGMSWIIASTVYDEEVENPYIVEKMKKFTEQNPGFVKTLDDIVNNRPNGCKFDLKNNNNIMKRKNGTYVIIDPYYS